MKQLLLWILLRNMQVLKINNTLFKKFIIRLLKKYFILLQNILDALHKATEKRTSIVIAHRLLTVMDADDILVLDQGNLVERGTHESLLSIPNSLYSKLWETQHLGMKKPQEQEEKSKVEQTN